MIETRWAENEKRYIEANGGFVLLIDVQGQLAADALRMFHQLPADSAGLRVSGHRNSLDIAAVQPMKPLTQPPSWLT